MINFDNLGHKLEDVHFGFIEGISQNGRTGPKFDAIVFLLPNGGCKVLKSSRRQLLIADDGIAARGINRGELSTFV